MCSARRQRPLFRHRIVQKWSETPRPSFTCNCASCRSVVPLACKSAPRMVCFVHFYLKMRFAPQQRAIFIGDILNNYFGDGVTSQNIFKISLNCNMVSDGVPISQNDLIKFYDFEMVRLYYSMMGLTCPIRIRNDSTEIPKSSPPKKKSYVVILLTVEIFTLRKCDLYMHV